MLSWEPQPNETEEAERLLDAVLEAAALNPAELEAIVTSASLYQQLRQRLHSTRQIKAPRAVQPSTSAKPVHFTKGECSVYWLVSAARS